MARQTSGIPSYFPPARRRPPPPISQTSPTFPHPELRPTPSTRPGYQPLPFPPFSLPQTSIPHPPLKSNAGPAVVGGGGVEYVGEVDESVLLGGKTVWISNLEPRKHEGGRVWFLWTTPPEWWTDDHNGGLRRGGGAGVGEILSSRVFGLGAWTGWGWSISS